MRSAADVVSRSRLRRSSAGTSGDALERRRVAKPKRVPSTRDASHQTARVEQSLLEKLAELLLLSGSTSTELRAAVNRAVSAARRRRSHVSSKTPAVDWWLYARVLSAWYRNPDFTDEHGVGMPLPLQGRRSFHSLVAKALPRSKPRVVLAALRALGAVSVSSAGLVSPTSRSLIVTERTQMTLLRALHVCDAFISTVHSNWLSGGPSKTERGRGLFERSVVSERFDMRNLRAFDRLVRVHGQALLELLDGWLGEHEIKNRNGVSRNEGQVGVEIYVFAKRGSDSHRRARSRRIALT